MRLQKRHQLLTPKLVGIGLLYLLLCFVVASALVVHPASAASCSDQNSENALYSGTASPKNGTYDAYVKLPKRGQQATVSVYHETFTQGGELICSSPVSVKATGDAWVKVGRWKILDQFVSAYLISAALPIEPGANRPELMLLSSTNPVCRPDTECIVEVGGERGVIVPATEALDQNGLVITVPQAIDENDLARVGYYVDDVLMYTTPRLEQFDLRYVSFADQKMTRILQYSSGQEVVINSTAPSTHTDSLGNFLFRVFYTGQSTSKWLTFVALVAVLGAGGWLLVKRLLARRAWRMHHGFIKEREQKRVSSAELERDYQKRKLLAYAKKGITAVVLLCGVIVAVTLCTRYIVTVNQVDGSSMEETLKDRQYLIMNRLPVTWSTITGKQFKPARGAVVTIKEIYGNQSTKGGEYRTLVKRVIGLPGERIIVKGGHITVYNSEDPQGFNPDESAGWSETMISDLSTEVLDIQLLENEVFVIGDNRLVSVDSRMNGPIALSNIQGELIAPLPF